MKSPSDLSLSLARQWQSSGIRVQRLLGAGSWPVSVPIGKPSGRTFSERVQAVLQHVQAWREVKVGEVEWEPIRYRAGLEPIVLPVRWLLRDPSEWIAASGDANVLKEYTHLEQIVERVAPEFHALLVRQRSLWLAKALDEVVATARLAAQLTPGAAQGRPLRLIAEHGVDTKFFERNATLLTKLLDERFEGEASAQGLTTFLNAHEESSHWVLVVPLAAGLLPFKRLRLTTAELSETVLPGRRLLVVENEQCLHHLPPVPDTIAVLGAGLDLTWLSAATLATKQLAYWGDMDSWGLLMLGRARQHQPTITALLMDQTLYDRYAAISAVAEPTRAQALAPEGLLSHEARFYRYLLTRERGRLEQEYLPREAVEDAVINWANHHRQKDAEALLAEAGTATDQGPI